MTILNLGSLDSAVQAKIDALSVNSDTNEILQLAFAINNSDIKSVVATPDLLPVVNPLSSRYDVDIGTIIFVDSLGIPLVATKNGWAGFDGRIYNNLTTNLWMWGSNSYGQFGNLSTEVQISPVSIPAYYTWRQVVPTLSFSSCTLGISHDGVLFGWGANNVGQLGTNNTTSYSSPMSVVGGLTWASAATSSQKNSFGITTTGELWAWGENSNGKLGDNTTVSRSSPVSVVGKLVWAQVSGAWAHTAGLTTDGKAWCWGKNTNGALGDNTTVTRSSPVSVVGGFTWKQIVTSEDSVHALKNDGTIWGWGSNVYGQLGDNTGTTRSSPVSVVGGFTWKAVSAGGYNCAGVKSDDTLWAWGRNQSGSLGANVSSWPWSSPLSVVGGFTWKQLSSGYFHMAAIKSDNTLWSWGANSYGQLGDITTSSRSSPVSVVGGLTWSKITCGKRFTVGIKA